MGKFEKYYLTNIEESTLSDNRSVYGNQNNDFQAGFGHGGVSGSHYCNSQGEGSGFGCSKGNGYHYYPFQLIQYWKVI